MHSKTQLLQGCEDTTLDEYVHGKHYRVVCCESGSEREDLPIFTTENGTIKLDRDGTPDVERRDNARVPGGFVLEHVLSRRECDQIIKLTETFGFTEDAPVSLGRHIRKNENCVWLADDAICDALFERCRSLFPSEVQGGEVCGLNARWRLYKYNPSDIFKRHTDGSWPGSGLDSKGRSIVRDRYGDRWSQLTFVIYLNDEFEGGPTRFFLPDESGRGERIEVLKAGCGGAVCFFHGDHNLSPLHEGGLVTSGTKYIIRSDVLYMLPDANVQGVQGGWQQYYKQLPPGGIPRELLQLMAAATPAQQAQLAPLLEKMRQQQEGEDQ